MPEVYLPAGGMILFSEQDFDLVTESVWRVWVLKGQPRAVRDATSKCRRFRLHLHREVAFRMRPDLVKTPGRMSVKPINGDFLDVRRENLEITARPRKRGGSRRPAGHNAAPYRGTRPGKPAPKWSRPGAAGEAVRDD